MFNADILENKAMSGKTLLIKNNSAVDLYGLAPGKQMEIACDASGIPLERFWRRRLKDAKIDNCIEIVKKKGSK